MTTWGRLGLDRLAWGKLTAADPDLLQGLPATFEGVLPYSRSCLIKVDGDLD
jgi:hypothetical protein